MTLDTHTAAQANPSSELAQLKTMTTIVADTGDIDTIATDHCPFQQSEKDWGLNDFRKIPNGCAGIENMYPYMLGKANDGVISFEKAVELCSANPAKIFGCTGKGEIAPGKDADIVIFDEDVRLSHSIVGGDIETYAV